MEERLTTLENRVRDLQAELEDLKLNTDLALSGKTDHPTYSNQGLRDVYQTNRKIAKGVDDPTDKGRMRFQNATSAVNRKGGKTHRSKRRT